MGRLGLHQRKKLLIERSPGGLCGNGSKCERTFAERLRGWLGKWATNFRGAALARRAGLSGLPAVASGRTCVVTLVSLPVSLALAWCHSATGVRQRKCGNPA
jgi:hypothetical protein